MADEISQVVEVYISRETAQIDTASFSIPLLLVSLPDVVDNTDPEAPVTTPADVTNRVRVYTGLEAVATDFGATSTAYVMTTKLLGGQTRPATFMIGVKNSEETYTQGVNAVLAANGDWYMIAIDSKVSSDIKEVAAVIQAQRRMFAASTADVAVVNPTDNTDIGSFLNDTDYDRTFLVYHTLAASQFPEVGWMGGQISEVPGSNTWAFKSAPGVTADKLSATAIAALKDKRVNFYTRLGGVNIFQTGTTSMGEWIDTINE